MNAGRSESDIQALVMNMADEYNAALSEALQPIILSPDSSPASRYLAQGVLRNGTASAIDIATGPNPEVSLLDMLVLVSLQHWAFSENLSVEGITESQRTKAAERLQQAENTLWRSASAVLSDRQQETLRGLIAAWTKANPGRRVVAFVRFEEFTDIRNDQTLATRASAEGLFREVSDATVAVDEARLLGERALWYASRYPLVLGQQAEFTLYRAANQPEFRKAVEALDSLKAVGATLSSRMDSLDRDIDRQQEQFFTKFTAARSAAIEEAKTALNDVARSTLKDLDARIAAASDATIARSFDRLAKERKDFLDDLESRQGKLTGVLADLRTTIAASNGLATELKGTADAFDRVVARFDPAGASGRKGLDIKDVRDAAAETAKTAEKLTALLERTNELATSKVWDERLQQLDHSTAGVVDRAFWRGLWLVLILLAGQAALRFVPQKGRAA